MATAPFGAVLEALVKENSQGAIFSAVKGNVVYPNFHCCVSGLAVGVNKDPVGLIKLTVGRRACTCTTITVDYSDSFSPTSTINTWSVNWGDGNISNGAWPGVGSVSHPGGCGGYALPGTYTITLTVTDLLGATGYAVTQVEIVNCATFATIEMFCSTIGPGNPIWFTNDAGGNWADRSGHVLVGAECYDLRINPFTIPVRPTDTIDNTDNVELWAATDFGLYVAYDGARQGNSWQRVDLPEPALGLGEPEVKAVLPIHIGDGLEVYALCHNAANNRVWLYRTTDGGETWDNIELIPPADPSYSVQSYGWKHTLDISADGLYVYVVLLSGPFVSPNLIVVDYDLSGYTETVNGNQGSVWGGVRADYNYGEVMWYHGNFESAGEAIKISHDWGVTFEDRDNPDWIQHATEVRPLLMSIYDPRYLIAVNNDPVELETAISTDAGQTWVTSTIASPFVAHCGERGWWDDYLIFIGAQTPVAGDRLQLSINLGEGMWTERSGGIPAATEVTSIQILWNHGIL